jgi:hypothetical protein
MIADRFFFLLLRVASAAEDSGRVLESGFQCKKFFLFIFEEIWKLREIPKLRKDRIFDDFLECSPQSSFWLACPGSHALLENIPKNCSDLAS